MSRGTAGTPATPPYAGPVLHHVSLEVHPDEVEACAACWRLLGFQPVAPPASLRGPTTWLERAGTQIHLMHEEHPTAVPKGHPAVVVEDFEATFAVLAEAGHEPERRRAHWGAARAFVTIPGGHRVELMAAPPPRRD